MITNEDDSAHDDDMLLSNMEHGEMSGLCPSLAAAYEIK